MSFTAIVLAGSRPGRDPFAEQFGTDLKPLISIGGEPMVRRPVRALLESRNIANVVVLTQAPERIADVIPSDPRVAIRRSAGTIAQTMIELCSDPETRWPLLVTTADHALLNSATIDQFCLGAAKSDVAIGVIDRGVLMARFPKSQRTWIKFRGGAYTGANLFSLRSPRVAPAIELWRSVEQDRKKGWRLVSIVGVGSLVGAALRLLSIDDVLRNVGRRLGLTVKAVRLSDPVAGVDVDKPSDHTLVEAILAGRA